MFPETTPRIANELGGFVIEKEGTASELRTMETISDVYRDSGDLYQKLAEDDLGTDERTRGGQRP